MNPDTGKLLQEVIIPTKNVTSVAFGGPYLSELFVTTAMDDPLSGLKGNGEGGGIFKVLGLGVTGVPMNDFQM